MLLSELIRLSGSVPTGMAGDAEISSLESDSRKVEPGALFVCMPGKNLDSHAFIPQAEQAGAVAVFAHSEEGFVRARELGLACLWSPSGSEFQDGVWKLAKAFHQNPTANMQVVGVTGTNGKTTTAWLMRDMLAALGKKPAYLGTLGIETPLHSRTLENTTPLPIELGNLLAECIRDGADCLALEVSSHALAEKRADMIEFDAAVFTNLTQDHLDFHGSMEEYAEAKLRLFTELPRLSRKRFVAALNLDDPIGAAWAGRRMVEQITYGFTDGDLQCTPIEVEVDRLRLQFAFRGQKGEGSARLGGTFNVSNCLSAVAGLLALGYPLEQALSSLNGVRPVPGRFEAVPNDKGIGVIVDYAHTPDALEKLLESARKLKHNRIWTVFGCGGDRDRNKRPKMAKSASSLSDFTVLTSDNPRTEDPETILDDVQAGIEPGREWTRIADRRKAIHYAVSHAEAGDIVIIAGKGHENYQIIGRTKYPMDDREMAKEALH